MTMRRVCGLLLACWVMIPAWAWSAIGIGPSCASYATAVDTLSILTCSSSGSDRAFSAGFVTNDSNQTVTAFTYAGGALTLITSGTFGAGNYLHAHYYRVNQAAGTQTLAVTLSGIADIYLGGLALTGVHQSVSIGTAVESHSSPVTSRSDNVTSAAGELVVDTVFVCDDGGLTVGAGQTEQWAATTGFAHSLHASTEAGSASVTMSWTWTNADCGMHIATPFKPSAAAARRRGTPLWFN